MRFQKDALHVVLLNFGIFKWSSAVPALVWWWHKRISGTPYTDRVFGTCRLDIWREELHNPEEGQEGFLHRHTLTQSLIRLLVKTKKSLWSLQVDLHRQGSQHGDYREEERTPRGQKGQGTVGCEAT